MMTINQRIKFTRILYGLKQKDVAKALGVTVQYLSGIETTSPKAGASQFKMEHILQLIYKMGESKKISVTDFEQCIQEINKREKELKQQDN